MIHVANTIIMFRAIVEKSSKKTSISLFFKIVVFENNESKFQVLSKIRISATYN